MQCATYFLADVPEDLSKYYPSTYYEGLLGPHAKPLPDPRGVSLESLDHSAQREAFKLAILRSLVAPGRLTEIGAGAGVFARAAIGAGFDVTAIEMDPRACSRLSAMGIKAINSDSPAAILADLAASRAITLWHVLEHLPDPWDVLREAADNLEPGGVLLLAMPNPDGVQARLLRGRWAHVDAPRHLFLISADTLTKKARTLGLYCNLMTSADPAGWNRFGWVNSLRRCPSARRSTPVATVAAAALTILMAPLERRALNGAAYTAAFVKRSAGP